MKNPSPSLQYTGIDGCPFGWLAITIDNDGQWEANIYEKFSGLIKALPNSTSFFIDMPIGLSERDRLRDVEQLARNELKPYRHSSVFSPPCRMALRQPDYEKAKATNFKVEGKRISIQAWNISEKIHELDKVLRRQPLLRDKCHESHPEICFKYLNGAEPLQVSKKRAEGQSLRMALIRKVFPQADEIVQHILTSYPRKFVRQDDITDALCLAVTAMQCEQQGYSWLKGKFLKDVRGIPMRMAYFNPS